MSATRISTTSAGARRRSAPGPRRPQTHTPKTVVSAAKVNPLDNSGDHSTVIVLGIDDRNKYYPLVRKELSTSGLYYKTFYGRNLRLFVIS
jgi:hypothetical protein